MVNVKQITFRIYNVNICCITEISIVCWTCFNYIIFNFCCSFIRFFPWKPNFASFIKIWNIRCVSFRKSSNKCFISTFSTCYIPSSYFKCLLTIPSNRQSKWQSICSCYYWTSLPYFVFCNSKSISINNRSTPVKNVIIILIWSS